MTQIQTDGNRYAIRPLFLLGVCFVLFAPVYWMGVELPPETQGTARAYENAALYQRIYPSLTYSFTRLRHGQWPFWNPKELCGVPCVGDPFMPLFQPLNAIALALPAERAMVIQAFLALFLMGGGFVLFMRSVGAGYLATLIGGVIYVCSGATAAAMSRPELAAALAWFPFLCWCIREFAREGRPVWLLYGSLAGAFWLLSGAYALIVASSFLLLPYTLLRLLFRGGTTAYKPAYRHMFAGIAVLFVFTVGLSALHWVPALNWAFSLNNPFQALWRLDLAGETPTKLSELYIQWLDPTSNQIPHLAYMGAISLLFIPAALFHYKGRFETFFFLAITPICFLLATLGTRYLGAFFPWKSFFFPAVFGVAILATLGAERLLSTGRYPHSPVVWGSTLLVLLTTGVFFYLAAATSRGYIFFFLLLLLPFLIFRVRFIGIACSILIALLLFLDLRATNSNRFQHPFNDAPLCFQTYSSLLQTANQQARTDRVLVATHPHNPHLATNLGMLFPLREVGAAAIPLTPDQAVWWKALGCTNVEQSTDGLLSLPSDCPHPQLLNFMAARTLLISDDSGLAPERWRSETLDLHPIRTAKDLTLYLNNSAKPRCYFTPRWRATSSTQEAIALLTAPDFDAAQTCTVQAAENALHQLLTTVPQDETDVASVTDETAVCTVTEDAPERVVLQVSAPQPGITVLADSYAPGWTATLDGVATPILQANGLFRGIATPKGKHTITFEYHPRAFWLGLGISCTTLALLVFLSLFFVFHRDKTPPSPPAR